MTNPGDASPRRSAVALARQLLAGFVALARLELQHGRQEIGAMLAAARGGAVLIGIAAALAFSALIALTVALIMGVGALTGLQPWFVSLLVTIVLLLVAGLLAYRGVRRIRIGPPEEMIASVKEEVAWAKRLIRRG